MACFRSWPYTQQGEVFAMTAQPNAAPLMLRSSMLGLPCYYCGHDVLPSVFFLGMIVKGV